MGLFKVVAVTGAIGAASCCLFSGIAVVIAQDRHDHPRETKPVRSSVLAQLVDGKAAPPTPAQPPQAPAAEPLPPTAPPGKFGWSSPDDVKLLIQRVGKPDVDETTAYDVPRPPMVTRWLKYRKANVQVMFLAKGNVYDPPPYSGWTFIGFLDTRTKGKLEVSEAFGRLDQLKAPKK